MINIHAIVGCKHHIEVGCFVVITTLAWQHHLIKHLARLLAQCVQWCWRQSLNGSLLLIVQVDVLFQRVVVHS